MPDLTPPVEMDGSTDSDLFEMLMGMTVEEWNVLSAAESDDELQP